EHCALVEGSRTAPCRHCALGGASTQRVQQGVPGSAFGGEGAGGRVLRVAHQGRRCLPGHLDTAAVVCAVAAGAPGHLDPALIVRAVAALAPRVYGVFRGVHRHPPVSRTSRARCSRSTPGIVPHRGPCPRVPTGCGGRRQFPPAHPERCWLFRCPDTRSGGTRGTPSVGTRPRSPRAHPHWQAPPAARDTAAPTAATTGATVPTSLPGWRRATAARTRAR